MIPHTTADSGLLYQPLSHNNLCLLGGSLAGHFLSIRLAIDTWNVSIIEFFTSQI